MNENKILNASDFMQKFANVDFFKSDKITSVWKKVVSKVRVNKYESENSEKRIPIGERLAYNTKIADLKNGILLVETDHSGWIQYLKIYQKFILNGLKKELPDFKITSLAFKLKGENVSLRENCDNYENQMKTESKEFLKKVEEQESKLNEKKSKIKNDGKIEKKYDLPPEISAKFDSIRNSVLTNSKFK